MHSSAEQPDRPGCQSLLQNAGSSEFTCPAQWVNSGRREVAVYTCVSKVAAWRICEMSILVGLKPVFCPTCRCCLPLENRPVLVRRYRLESQTAPRSIPSRSRAFYAVRRASPNPFQSSGQICLCCTSPVPVLEAIGSRPSAPHPTKQQLNVVVGDCRCCP